MHPILREPALDNPRLTAIRFVLDERSENAGIGRWRPAFERTPALRKLPEPIWTRLDEGVSCILADQGVPPRPEALLSFWGEPFMARASGQDVPRDVFHVQPDSELIPRLRELEQSYRLGRA